MSCIIFRRCVYMIVVFELLVFAAVTHHRVKSLANCCWLSQRIRRSFVKGRPPQMRVAARFVVKLRTSSRWSTLSNHALGASQVE